MVNAELAAAFDEVADLMELLGEDRFRIGSYRRAARVLGEFHEDIAVVCKEKRLTDIPSVGKSMAEKICEFLESGKIQRLEELKAKLPRELVTLLQIPNMG